MGNISEFRKCDLGMANLLATCELFLLVPAKVTSYLVDLWSTINTIYELMPDPWTTEGPTHTQSPFKICLLDSLYPPYHIHHDKLVQVNFLQSSIENDNIWPMTREKIKWGGFTVFLLKVWCFYISLWEHVSPEAQITWQQQTILTVEAKKRARSRATSVSNLTVKKGSKRG